MKLIIAQYQKYHCSVYFGKARLRSQRWRRQISGGSNDGGKFWNPSRSKFWKTWFYFLANNFWEFVKGGTTREQAARWVRKAETLWCTQTPKSRNSSSRRWPCTFASRWALEPERWKRKKIQDSRFWCQKLSEEIMCTACAPVFHHLLGTAESPQMMCKGCSGPAL